MSQKASNKIFIVLAVLLVTLAGARFYVNYNSEGTEKALRTDVKVMLYSKTGCGYCDKAKALLQSRGIPYEVVELTNNKDLIIKLVNQTGQNTVPYVFVNDEFIGGYQDLQELDKAGEL
ncbi:MAG: glutathione S-transferase N-terminal domain-containing protein [Rickettsiaceae bacterium]|nr:glutathione S-transferase N-terminal domain-containing protein [Rickettsiaceae bacterium]MDP4832558.1 glutathione S-transferase N-terminal domain-containing protein [Rickettsiaceae bacterium]MDP5020200.1 glutathione S-transferase N-terminal domain-containing protein [Rickettsiaceae bacterium]MDP5082904.1 glutathione S-transferase N-terminal domain-containing protein [Rickettsiaceae bacterium]